MEGLVGESDRKNHLPSNTFFVQTKYGGISNASRLLEYVRNGADSNDLLLFLRYLSKIDWLNIYNKWAQRRWTNEIAHWVCHNKSRRLILGNPFDNLLIHKFIQESLTLEPGDIRNAMYKVFTEIHPRGIVPGLSQQISRASEIFESKSCLRCLQDHVPEGPLNLYDFGLLSRRIVPMCIDQNFFQILCTRMVESTLLGMVKSIFRTRYVFIVFDLWK